MGCVGAWVGVFVSSWFGGVLLSVGEWIIRKVPLVKHIYSASKQIGAAVNPGDEQQSKAFKECVIIKHPRHGEYAFAFVTGETLLQVKHRQPPPFADAYRGAVDMWRRCLWRHSVHALDLTCDRRMNADIQRMSEEMKLYSVYVPTNHVYIGDVFLLQEADIIRTNISVREGLGKHPEPHSACDPPQLFCSSGMLLTSAALLMSLCRDRGQHWHGDSEQPGRAAITYRCNKSMYRFRLPSWGTLSVV